MPQESVCLGALESSHLCASSSRFPLHPPSRHCGARGLEADLSVCLSFLLRIFRGLLLLLSSLLPVRLLQMGRHWRLNTVFYD